MGPENATQAVPIMIGGKLAADFTGGRIEEGQQVGRAVAPIRNDSLH